LPLRSPTRWLGSRRADGARRLYVSATPSGSAVGFYPEPRVRADRRAEPELFALEPDDIHMILEL